jgi:two-component system phosphate regulon sensor histidine kinase PhoR
MIEDAKNRMVTNIKIARKLISYFSDVNELKARIYEISDILHSGITVVDLKYKVLIDSQRRDVSSVESFQFKKEITSATLVKYGYALRNTGDNTPDVLYVALKSDKYYIISYTSLESIEQRVNKTLILIPLAIVFIIAGIAALNKVTTKYLTLPIQEIVTFAKRFRQAEYDARLPVYNLDELGFAKLSLNYMAKNISRNVDSLAMQKMRIETVIKSVSEGILLLDEEGIVYLNNKGFFDILQINERKVTGLYFFEAITNSRINTLVEETISLGEKRKENLTIHKMGTFENTTISVSAIPIENNRGTIVLFEDVTEEFNLEKLKREFVSNASHEFKTPLAIIKGYVETLLDGVDEKTIRDNFLNKIYTNITRLNNIVNDVITLNKIEDYKDVFAFTEVNIRKIITSCVQILTPYANKMEVEIINEVKDKAVVESSPELLEIIIYNLVDNAIKYNKKSGYVNIKAKVKKDAVTLRITDSGIGIPGDLKNKIFERFYTVNRCRSRDKGGTGLGLSIVKHAVMIIKAKISVADNPEGTGSMFTIKIPVDAKKL